MTKRTTKKPPPRSTGRTKKFYELLADCVDVLDAPAYAPGLDEVHLTGLAEAINNGQAPEDQELLLCILFALRSLMFVDAEHAGGAFHVRRANRLAVDLKAILEDRGVPSYLYHGTLSGNLRSIQAEGLVPGRKPVFTKSAELRSLAEEAVFFSDTWRGRASSPTPLLRTAGPMKDAPSWFVFR